LTRKPLFSIHDHRVTVYLSCKYLYKYCSRGDKVASHHVVYDKGMCLEVYIMKDYFRYFYYSLLVCSVLMSACATKTEIKTHTKSDEPLPLESFYGKKIGMNTGTIWEPLITDIAQAKPTYYNTLEESYLDIRNGIIDGVMTDLSIVKIYLNTPEGNDMTYSEIPFDLFNSPMGAISLDTDLLQLFNEFLQQITNDGTLKMLKDYWFGSSINLALPMPPIESSKIINRKIKVATIDQTVPFSFLDAQGELKGYCIDLMRRFAAKEHLDIHYIVLDFGSLIPTIVNHRADIAITNISITEDRKKRVRFSDPIYFDQAGILALKVDEP